MQRRGLERVELQMKSNRNRLHPRHRVDGLENLWLDYWSVKEEEEIPGK
jgi:hypothetical protein